MEACGNLVQTIAEGAEQPWGFVRALAFAGCIIKRYFTAKQQLAAANHTLRVRQSLGGQHGVAAPAHVHRVGLTMLEAEAGNAGGKQQRSVEIRATCELRLLKTSDGERLTLRAAFAKMVAGGGQDFGCGFGQRETELDLADFQRGLGTGFCSEQVGHDGLLTGQTTGQKFEMPFEFHALLFVARSDCHAGHIGRASGTGTSSHIGVAVAGHSIEASSHHAVEFHTGHGELGEEFDAVAAQHHTLFTNPAFGLSRQDGRPGGVIERTGNALRLERIVRSEQGLRIAQRATPMNDTRQVIAGSDQTDCHVGIGLYKIDGGERGSVSGGTGEGGGVLGHSVSFDVYGMH